MDELKRNITRMKLKKRGLRVNDYINACQKADNDLFKNIAKTKRNQRARKASRKAYKQTIKDNARAERDILNISTDLYSTAKTEARKEYKQRVKSANDKKQFKKYMKEFMQKCRKEISFEIDIGDNEDKRLAFTETLRQLYKLNKGKVAVKAESLDGAEYYSFTTIRKGSKLSSQ